MRKAVSAYNFVRVKRDTSGSRVGSYFESYGNLAFSGKLAVADGNVMRVIVSSVRRNDDERFVVSFGVVCKLDVRDRQSIRIVESAVTVNVDLSGDRFTLAVNRKVQTFLLTDSDDFGNVVQHFHRDVAVHLVSRVERSLKGRIHNVADLCGSVDPVSLERDVFGHGSREVVRCRRVAEIPAVEDAVLFFGISRFCYGRVYVDVNGRISVSAVGVKRYDVNEIGRIAERIGIASDNVYFVRVVRIRDNEFDRHNVARVVGIQIEYAAGERVYIIVNRAVRYVRERVHKEYRIGPAGHRSDKRKVEVSVCAVESEGSRSDIFAEGNSVVARPILIVCVRLRRGLNSVKLVRRVYLVDLDARVAELNDIVYRLVDGIGYDLSDVRIRKFRNSDNGRSGVFHALELNGRGVRAFAGSRCRRSSRHSGGDRRRFAGLDVFAVVLAGEGRSRLRYAGPVPCRSVGPVVADSRRRCVGVTVFAA